MCIGSVRQSLNDVSDRYILISFEYRGEKVRKNLFLARRAHEGKSK